MNTNPTHLINRSRSGIQWNRVWSISSSSLFVWFSLINICRIQAFQPRNIFTRTCNRSNNWNAFSPQRSRSTIFENDSLHQNFRKISSLHVSNNDEVSTTLAINTEIQSVDEKNDEKIYQTAIKRTLLSVAAASMFGLSIFHWMGPESGEEFFAGYLVEQSLSVDNLFVFLLLFDYFKVPRPYQNRVLNYGIIGAVIMRAVVIALGSAVLHRFKPVLLVFASILIFSSYTNLVESFGEGDKEEEDQDMGENAIVKFSKSLLPTTEMYENDNFFTTLDGGVKKATPLLLCLVAVEISDIVFAVDSIPAVFGVTEVSSFCGEVVKQCKDNYDSKYENKFLSNQNPLLITYRILSLSLHPICLPYLGFEVCIQSFQKPQLI